MEALKQVSNLRLKLQEYCKKVALVKQEETNTGLAFSLKLSGLPSMDKFLKEKQKAKQSAEKAEKQAADAEKAEKEAEKKGA